MHQQRGQLLFLTGGAGGAAAGSARLLRPESSSSDEVSDESEETRWLFFPPRRGDVDHCWELAARMAVALRLAIRLGVTSWAKFTVGTSIDWRFLLAAAFFLLGGGGGGLFFFFFTGLFVFLTGCDPFLPAVDPLIALRCDSPVDLERHKQRVNCDATLWGQAVYMLIHNESSIVKKFMRPRFPRRFFHYSSDASWWNARDMARKLLY